MLVKHGYRLAEIRQMTQPEIDARVDLLVGRKRSGTRYVAKGKPKAKS